MNFNNNTIRTAVKEWFENSKEAIAKYGHISNWDVIDVTDMSELFYKAKTFNENLSKWYVGNVTDMSRMFAGAESFNQDIGNWDVSKVTNMYGMFENALSFNQDLRRWEVSRLDKSYEVKPFILNNDANSVKSENKKIIKANVSTLFVKALKYHLNQDYKQAVNNYKLIIDYLVENDKILTVLSTTEFVSKDFSVSFSIEEIYYQRGHAKMMYFDFSCIDDFTQVIKMNQNNKNAFYMRGYAYFFLDEEIINDDNYADYFYLARRDIIKYLNFSPDDLDAIFLLCRIEFILRELVGKSYEKSVEEKLGITKEITIIQKVRLNNFYDRLKHAVTNEEKRKCIRDLDEYVAKYLQ